LEPELVAKFRSDPLQDAMCLRDDLRANAIARQERDESFQVANPFRTVKNNFWRLATMIRERPEGSLGLRDY
jgi:hypothetical protein